MSFVVGMKLRVSYRTGILGWDYDLNPHCPKLDMQLVPSTGNGGIIFDHPKVVVLIKQEMVRGLRMYDF
ncbi:hypothetical protein Gohar_017824 [Gossypium harknessii]|uniref:Uncharacterized protein n=1 Tax=Gossypium harknessii TaxID=34285 RepID=A0A7J9G9D2_9ROSI|nr:hypothetical protein [Gossypium harknessii]